MHVDACLSLHLLPANAEAIVSHPIAALVVVVDGVALLRTFDPERHHFCSFARILQLAGLTLVQGLQKLKLERSIDYHLELGVAGPALVDFWVPVARARKLVATVFDSVPYPLQILLDESLDKCFTLYDATRASLLHNWALKSLPRDEYSTRRLQATCFALEDVERIANKHDWIRTAVAAEGLGSYDSAEQGHLDRQLIFWASDAAERARTMSVTDHDAPWRPIVDHLGSYTSDLSDGPLEPAVVDLCERLLLRQAGVPQKWSRPAEVVSIVETCHAATQTGRTYETRHMAIQADVSSPVAPAQSILPWLILVACICFASAKWWA